MTQHEIERFLRIILGDHRYGGISLAFDSTSGQFVMYRRTGGPIEIEEMARGYSLERVIEDYEDNQKCRITAR